MSTRAVLLIDRFDRWTQLALYLEALSTGRDQMADIVTQKIARWEARYNLAWPVRPSAGRQAGPSRLPDCSYAPA